MPSGAQTSSLKRQTTSSGQVLVLLLQEFVLVSGLSAELKGAYCISLQSGQSLCFLHIPNLSYDKTKGTNKRFMMDINHSFEL